ncbi:aspartate/glutamate racemase family protein [Acidobacteriota bacterium]
MSKKIGILGGISHASTVRYYEYILKKYHARRRDYHYPEVVIFSLDLAKLIGFEERDDLDSYVRYLTSGLQALEKAGVDFIVIAANSPHAVFEIVQKRVSIPMISIVETTALRAEKLGLKKLLLTGIKSTMQSAFYSDVFQKYSIPVLTPDEAEQDEINDAIFRELVLGIYKDSTRNRILEIITGYNVDGIILGCTELSMMLSQEDTHLRLLNTLELHAQAALDFALTE